MNLRLLTITSIFLQLIIINSYGQTENPYFKSISIIKIDSIVQSIDSCRNCKETIAEGIIIKNKKNIGGFSTYYFENHATNTISRIRNSKTIKLHYKKEFYFNEDKLIFAEVQIENYNHKKNKKIHSSKYYFNNDSLIMSINENMKYSCATEILKEGKIYLDKRNQELIEDELILRKEKQLEK